MWAKSGTAGVLCFSSPPSRDIASARSSMASSFGASLMGVGAGVLPSATDATWARLASSSCRCLCSSIDTRSASASSGSSFGSTPNSNPDPPSPAPPIPSSPWITGDEISASDRWGPGGTETRWLPAPSFPFRALTNAVRSSLFDTSSPKLTTSTLTFSFLSLFASFTSSFSSVSTGLPTKATIRILWFLPCRCFKAKWAIRMPVRRLMVPCGWTRWSLDRILPTSDVRVARTSTLAKVKRPTLFSGFDLVLEWQTRFTASCWACNLVGRKSPFRI